ncbi:putative aconitate hydratase [Paecilomyces variotii]|uniref:Large ribosomal subunit protein bL21m n=1 Tax=Byssochlamys spectabilis TaxID=264951 RepID=A0A443I4Y9_BYSSP|nr:putative aconitate hydratase [Paecilomyces variotii]KAJ9360554.1 hypothetical protein DTO280E4_4271 [Paecilomyces variotii]RWQ99149.1 putative aconitate hydratase [Paecilomyces variotii]
MFSRTALRSAFEVRWTPSVLPSLSFAPILPQRAGLHQAASSTVSSEIHPHKSPVNPSSPLSATPRAQTSQPEHLPEHRVPSESGARFVPVTRNHIPPEKLPIQPTFTAPLKMTKSLVSTLPHLTTQSPHYIVAHLHARPYLLTAGDHLRLPFHMPKVKPGDILRFNRASVIGSRDFTLKGAPYIDERMFECRVRVLGVDAEPMRIKEKTKRRQRHTQHIRSKHKYTLMRVMDVKVKSVEELLEEGAEVVEEGDLASATMESKA